MPVTSFSPLLGLALPTTGDLSGTWGTTVNDSITSLLDTAVAGTTTLSTDGDVTLSTTNGAANQARSAVLLCSGARTALRTITAPAQSKAYVVINQTTGGFGVKVVGAGPTTGVTIANGDKALIAWNGSDFVVISSTSISNLTGTLPVTSGGTGQTSYTNGQLLIGNTTGNTLTKSTLTAGSGISITNGAGSITIAASGGPAGTVTSVDTSGAVNGLTLTGGPITTTGTVTLGGGVNVSTITTGTLPVARGGTGASSYTNGQLLIGSTPTGGLSAATLTAGTGINITNGAGAITIATAGGGSNIQTFAATGTYTKPPGANFVMVELWGAGGGGGAANGPQNKGGMGGGGGGYSYRVFAAPDVGATVTVTIGAGGGGGASQSAGANGGTSNFGTLLYAGGGYFGSTPTSPSFDKTVGGIGGSSGIGMAPPGSGPNTQFLRATSLSPTNGIPQSTFTVAGGDNQVGGTPATPNFVGFFNWSIWGGGRGANEDAPSFPAIYGGISLFGGGGGGRGGQPPSGYGGDTGGNGGIGRAFGRQAPSPFPAGPAGGGPGVAGSAGAIWNGGGGGGQGDGTGPSAGGWLGGVGGIAGGGGGGGGCPPGSGFGGAGGAGGNGYAIVYTW